VTAGVESKRVGELPPVSVAPERETLNEGCEKLLGWFVEDPPANVKFVFAPAVLAVRVKVPPEPTALTGERAALRALAKAEATDEDVSFWP